MTNQRTKPERETSAAKPLLAECLNAGEVTALFPLLKNWPRQKLNALLGEIENADEFTEKVWAELAMKAENFLSSVRSKSLDARRMEIMLALSEVASVALYYLGKAEEVTDAHK